MKDSLFSTKLSFGEIIVATSWASIITQNHPPFGLYNYGLGVTPKGRIILHGGISNGEIVNRTVRNFNAYSELWVIKLTDPFLNFVLYNYNDVAGGFSRILSLENEKVCIFNKNFKNGLAVFDAEAKNFYSSIDSVGDSIIRESFGVVLINSTMLVVGGYGMEQNEPRELYASFVQAVQLKKYGTADMSSSKDILYSLNVLLVIPLVAMIILIMKYIRKYNVETIGSKLDNGASVKKTKENPETKEKKVEHDNKALDSVPTQSVLYPQKKLKDDDFDTTKMDQNTMFDSVPSADGERTDVCDTNLYGNSSP